MKHGRIEELAPWCALNRIFGFAPKAGLGLIREFGGAEEVFLAGSSEVAKRLGARSPYPAQISAASIDWAAEELRRLSENGDRFLCIDDERYPELLKDCEDAPIGLYIRSDSNISDIFGKRPMISIVGTRRMTSYGREWCTRIVAAMSKARVKPTIVSGLAFGIDITAHTAALENGLPTIAVMATGTDKVYPFSHGFAADRIRQSPGSALITDYPLETTPQAINFLRRNRIIAGLANAVVLVESGKKGGGLMTCRLATSYSREVYSLPGRIDDLCSAGCNSLIHEKMAEAITDVDEFVDSLGLGSSGNAEVKDLKTFVYRLYKAKENGKYAERAANIADIILKNRDIRKEEICSLLDLDYSEVSTVITMMECDGILVTDILGQCSIKPGML